MADGDEVVSVFGYYGSMCLNCVAAIEGISCNVEKLIVVGKLNYENDTVGVE